MNFIIHWSNCIPQLRRRVSQYKKRCVGGVDQRVCALFALSTASSYDNFDIALRHTLALTFIGKKQCDKSSSVLQLSQSVCQRIYSISGSFDVSLKYMISMDIELCSLKN